MVDLIKDDIVPKAEKLALVVLQLHREFVVTEDGLLMHLAAASKKNSTAVQAVVP